MPYVFNIGLTFGDGDSVAIIACQSDYSMSRAKVSSIVTSYFKTAMRAGKPFDEAVAIAVNGVTRECNIHAVIVKSDITYAFMDSKNRRGRYDRI